jgi:hypothetical protein
VTKYQVSNPYKTTCSITAMPIMPSPSYAYAYITPKVNPVEADPSFKESIHMAERFSASELRKEEEEMPTDVTP